MTVGAIDVHKAHKQKKKATEYDMPWARWQVGKISEQYT